MGKTIYIGISVVSTLGILLPTNSMSKGEKSLNEESERTAVTGTILERQLTPQKKKIDVFSTLSLFFPIKPLPCINS